MIKLCGKAQARIVMSQEQTKRALQQWKVNNNRNKWWCSVLRSNFKKKKWA